MHHHRIRPNRRRKSQPHTHSSSPSAIPIDDAASSGVSLSVETSFDHKRSMSRTISANEDDLYSTSKDYQTTKNVVNKPTNNKTQSSTSQDCSRISMNLNLKNVCTPASRGQLIVCDEGDDASTHSDNNRNSKDLLRTKTATNIMKDVDGTAGTQNNVSVGSGANIGFIASIRSWANTICQWRMCFELSKSTTNSKSSRDIEQYDTDRNREASVGSVFGVGEMTTSNRILRAFSHVGEHLKNKLSVYFIWCIFSTKQYSI